MKICSVDGCDKESFARGHCKKHYNQLRAKGELSGNKKCKINGCEKVYFGRGYCRNHYEKKRRDGEFQPLPPKKCRIEGCKDKHHAKGYCSKHLAKAQRNNELPGDDCKESGCKNIASTKGYCPKHYNKRVKSGEFGRKNPCKVDGCDGKQDSHGYCQRHGAQLRKYGKIFERTKYDKNNIAVYGDIAVMDIYNAHSKLVAQTIFDAHFVDEVRKYKWNVNKMGYVRCAQPSIYLHRFLFAHDQPNTDHKNGNTRDNRLQNLRPASHAENSRNCRNKPGVSGVVGVVKNNNKWGARIKAEGRVISLGSFNSVEEAAKVRKEAALKYYGEFAYDARDS